jgi:RND superfamily putative drug exporter
MGDPASNDRGIVVVGDHGRGDRVLAASVSGRLKSGNHVHSAAYTANQRIAKQYGGATSDSGGLVLDLPAGQTVQSPAVQAELTAVDAGL